MRAVVNRWLSLFNKRLVNNTAWKEMTAELDLHHQRGFADKEYSDFPGTTEKNVVAYWDSNVEFNRVYREIADRTVIHPVRCFILYELAMQVRTLEGDIAEIGVYRGGSTRLLARICGDQQKRVFAWDTFKGMPPTDPEHDNAYRQGDFGDVSLVEVKDYLGDLPNVEIIQATFPDQSWRLTNNMFCIVHVDVDIYRSCLDCCEFFYPRLVKGGVMLFDDYGFWDCRGVKDAVDEFFVDKAEQAIYLPTGQCLVIKH